MTDECANSKCRRYGANSSGDRNVQLVNVDGTERISSDFGGEELFDFSHYK